MIRLLHVDDEADFAELTARYLEREDDRFDVETATSAAEALDRLDAGRFDAIVSDYQMPGTDGLELLRAVRRDAHDLPFILFTGKGSEEIASEAITAGVTDYIQKGTGTEQYALLANRVANAVESQRAVRQTELNFKAMETAAEGISLVEPDGTFSYVNTAFADLFEYEPAELVGEHWTVLYHNEEAERLENDILPAVPETGYWSGETVRLTKRGERRVTDHRLAHTDEGVIVCTAQDVTGERTASAATDYEYDLLVEAVDGQAFYTLDHEGYVTRWNAGAERITGYTAEEILGEHLSAFFPEADRQAGLPDRLIETAKVEESTTHEGWRVRQDGSRFRAEVTLSASFDDHGTLRGFGEVVRQSTEPQPAQ